MCLTKGFTRVVLSPPLSISSSPFSAPVDATYRTRLAVLQENARALRAHLPTSLLLNRVLLWNKLTLWGTWHGNERTYAVPEDKRCNVQ